MNKNWKIKYLLHLKVDIFLHQTAGVWWCPSGLPAWSSALYLTAVWLCRQSSSHQLNNSSRDSHEQSCDPSLTILTQLRVGRWNSQWCRANLTQIVIESHYKSTSLPVFTLSVKQVSWKQWSNLLPFHLVAALSQHVAWHYPGVSQKCHSAPVVCQDNF